MKKLLAFSIICLLMFMSFPATSSNDSQSVAMLNEDLVVTVTTDKEVYYLGEPVTITISVTNYGPDTALVFGSSQLADFKITKSYGRHVYQWSWHFVFIQMITNVLIKHGETKVLLRWIWFKLRDFYPFPLLHIPVPPGKYYITGWMVKGISHPKINDEPVEVTLRWLKFT